MFNHVPTAARSLTLSMARAVRDGAKYRIELGGRVGDNMFADCIHDMANELSGAIHDSTGMCVPASTLRPLLWRAARVGEMYA